MAADLNYIVVCAWWVVIHSSRKGTRPSKCVVDISTNSNYDPGLELALQSTKGTGCFEFGIAVLFSCCWMERSELDGVWINLVTWSVRLYESNDGGKCLQNSYSVMALCSQDIIIKLVAGYDGAANTLDSSWNGNGQTMSSGLDGT